MWIYSRHSLAALIDIKPPCRTDVSQTEDRCCKRGRHMFLDEHMWARHYGSMKKKMLSRGGKKCLAQMGAAIYIPVLVPDCGGKGFKTSSDKNVHVVQYLPKRKKKNSAFLQYQCFSVQSFLSIHSCPSGKRKTEKQKTQHKLLYSTTHGSYLWPFLGGKCPF